MGLKVENACVGGYDYYKEGAWKEIILRGFPRTFHALEILNPLVFFKKRSSLKISHVL